MAGYGEGRSVIEHHASAVQVEGARGERFYEARCSCGWGTALNMPVEWSAQLMAECHEIREFRNPPWRTRFHIASTGRPGNLGFELRCYDCFRLDKPVVEVWPRPKDPEAMRSLKADVQVSMARHEKDVHGGG